MSIATEISRISAAKEDIKDAIEAKGVTVPSDATIDEYADLIDAIPSGGGSGFPDWVNDGKTHLWIEIDNESQLEQYVRVTTTAGLIEWGDGTETNITSSINFPYAHTYGELGRYRIDISTRNASITFGDGTSSSCIMGTTQTGSGKSITGYYSRIGALYQAEIGTYDITGIDSYAFNRCTGLLRVYIPNTITSIGSYAFETCYSLSQVIVQTNCIASIEQYAFHNCYSLRHFPNVPNTQIGGTLGAYSFQNCQSLSKFTIPSTISSLGNYSLSTLYSLEELIVNPISPPTVGTSALASIPSTCVIKVPSLSLRTYKSASGWSTYASQIVAQ